MNIVAMNKLMFYTIVLILFFKYAGASEVTTKDKVIEVLDKIEQIEKDGDKVYWNKITTVKPKNAADQYCYVKVIIKQSDNQIIKEEILECADGRKRVDGPTYWHNQNIAERIAGMGMLLKHQEKYV